MERKQKIIVSVIVGFLFLFAIVGITYAYFLTRIVGNTNTNSVSITTANLRLVYGDGTTKILTKDNIVPGMTVGTKDFTVTNEGDIKIDEYVVYLENVVNDFKYTDDVNLKITCTSKLKDGSTGTCRGYDGKYPKTNTLLISNSIEIGEIHSYELVVEYVERYEDQSDDMDKTLQGKIQIYDPKDVVSIVGSVSGNDSNYYVEMQSEPKTSEIIDDTYIVPGISIGEHHLYLKYKDENGDVQIAATKTLNVKKGSSASIDLDAGEIVFTDNLVDVTIDIQVTESGITFGAGELVEKKILSDLIIANAKSGESGRTVYSATPSSSPVTTPSAENEKTLSEQSDDYTSTTGKKSYYFRGNVEDNYVQFNNMCWRIVRIEGDGSIKLTLAAEKECSEITSSDISSAVINNGEPIYFGYIQNGEYFINYDYAGKGFKTTVEKWYNDNRFTDVQSSLKKDKWCLGGNLYMSYDSNGNFITDTSDTSVYRYYNPWVRYEKNNYVDLVCGEYDDSFEAYVGALTMDELVLAGANKGTPNKTFYLYDNAQVAYWGISMSYYSQEITGFYDNIYSMSPIGSIIANPVYFSTSALSPEEQSIAVRPAITLKEGITVTYGNGTISNPYIINVI